MKQPVRVRRRGYAEALSGARNHPMLGLPTSATTSLWLRAQLRLAPDLRLLSQPRHCEGDTLAVLTVGGAEVCHGALDDLVL